MNNWYKYIALTLSLVFGFAIQAQTYMGAGGAIPDHGTMVYTLNVSGLDSLQINGNYGLETVCVDITHTSDEQIGIFITAPDGTTVELSTGNGSTGNDYTGTCFDMAAGTLVGVGVPPFTGSFVPEENIGNVNNEQNGNGTWRLIVQDVLLADTGILNTWSLNFGYSPSLPVGSSAGPCDDFNEPGCVCPDSTPNCLLLPDVFIATSLLADTNWQDENFGVIKVTNSAANIGYGPIEFKGTGQWFCGDTLVGGSMLCGDGTYSKQSVEQHIYVKTGLGFFDFVDTLVGTMGFHSDLGHNHLHIDDWVINTLRIRGEDPDPTTWDIVGTGAKASFCVYDHIACDNLFFTCEYEGTVHTFGAQPNKGLGNGYASCGASVQGISVGYSDVYDYLTTGQEVFFDSLCNGDYYLVAEYDPNRQFLDLDRSNDVSAVPVTLKEQLNCCKANFTVDTLNYNSFQFHDKTVSIPNNWLWHFGDGDTSNAQFPMHTYSTPGFYTVRLITQNSLGCVDSASQIVFVDSCSADFAINAMNDSTFSFTSTYAGSIAQWNWNFDDGNTSTASAPTNTYSSSGNYTVSLAIIDTNGCTDTVTQTLMVSLPTNITSIDLDNFFGAFSVYPNPTKDIATMAFSVEHKASIKIDLYNSIGQKEKTLVNLKSHPTGNFRQTVELPQKGVYLLKVKVNEIERTFKVVGL